MSYCASGPGFTTTAQQLLDLLSSGSESQQYAVEERRLSVVDFTDVGFCQFYGRRFSPWGD